VSRLFWIALGGALGTLARHGLSTWCQERFGTTGLPYGTLAVNVVGSLLLGAVMEIALTTALLSPTMRFAVATGVMGGFTTYSTFNYETLRFMEQRAWALGVANVVVTVVACLLAGLAGAGAARRALGG
jgi:fluoride exporter